MVEEPVIDTRTRGTPQVVCIGITPSLQRTIAFDRLTVGDVNRAARVDVSAAGKATNVARVLHALGVRVKLVSLVGGRSGDQFVDLVDAEGIPHEAIPVAAPTRTCETLIDRATEQVTELVEEMAPPTPQDWARLRSAVAAQQGNGAMLAFSGTMPPGVDVGAYAGLVEAATRDGMGVLIDTQGDVLQACLPHGPIGIKINHHELESTVGRELPDDTSRLEAMRQLVQQGAGWVAVTRGAKPAWIWDGVVATRLTPPSIDVVNPIGSGDSVLAGIAAGLGRGLDPAEAFRFGLACGCANALTLLPGQVDPAEAERRVGEVVVERIGAVAG